MPSDVTRSQEPAAQPHAREVSPEADVVVPEPPAGAAEQFGPRLEMARRYAELLAGPGVERGLIGPREVERLWDRHLLNCVALSELIPDRARVVDVGSGSGLPGLVLAIARPDLDVTLLEPLLRRTVFLAECVETLELRNVEVLRGRAEEWARRMKADVVTARAVAPMDRLIGWCLPLLRGGGGMMLALKGDAASEELASVQNGLKARGARSWRVVELGAGPDSPAARVIRIDIGPAGYKSPPLGGRPRRGARG
ncbi:MAG TPA: 16S rRNA (guanine(527)-N(7))-methyltransferase RsmG [Actinocrinis sp.]|jgi:16S rRNA (guanine527-N7)-methyltransferase